MCWINPLLVRGATFRKLSCRNSKRIHKIIHTNFACSQANVLGSKNQEHFGSTPLLRDYDGCFLVKGILSECIVFWVVVGGGGGGGRTILDETVNLSEGDFLTLLKVSPLA